MRVENTRKYKNFLTLRGSTGLPWSEASSNGTQPSLGLVPLNALPVVVTPPVGEAAEATGVIEAGDDRLAERMESGVVPSDVCRFPRAACAQREITNIT